MISLEGVSVSYGEVAALEDVSFHVERGECVLVTGPSGCGKSTLGRVITGLVPHALPGTVSGRVEVDGLDLAAHPIPEIAQHVGMVFQRPASQLFHLTAENEVAFGPRNLGLDEAEVARRVDWALRATGLTDLRSAAPSSLSGGQKQCLAIAAALAMRTSVLVLDEPTASLDVPNTERVMEVLARLRDEHGITIVLMEHRLAEAAHLASRVVLMDEGRIVADGVPDEVFADRALRDRLGLRRPTEVPAVAWESLIETDSEAPVGSGALLALDRVTAGFNGHAVIHDVRLAIHPGEFIALVGDNGAGKSTLAMVAAGLIKPQSGRVRFSGDARPRPGLDVAILFQDPAEQLFTDTVDDEVAFAPTNWDRFDLEEHRRILDGAGLAELRDRRPLAISVGQQQRTALASCLGLRPRLLILDEPTLGQDWGHLSRLMDHVAELNRAGTAILLISHDYKLVHHYAHRIVLLREGRIEQVGTVHSPIREGGTP